MSSLPVWTEPIGHGAQQVHFGKFYIIYTTRVRGDAVLFIRPRPRRRVVFQRLVDIGRALGDAYALSPVARALDTSGQEVLVLAMEQESKANEIATLEYLTLSNRKDGLPMTVAPERFSVLTFVAQTITAMHEKGFSHNNLKPAAFVLRLSDDGKTISPDTVRLVSWQSARTVDNSDERTARTPAFTPPETLTVLPETDRKLVHARRQAGDVYAFGVLAFFVLSGRYPWYAHDVNVETLESWVADGHRDTEGLQALAKSSPRGPLSQLAGVIQDCWLQDWRARPKMTEVLIRIGAVRWPRE